MAFAERAPARQPYALPHVVRILAILASTDRLARVVAGIYCERTFSTTLPKFWFAATYSCAAAASAIG